MVTPLHGSVRAAVATATSVVALATACARALESLYSALLAMTERLYARLREDVNIRLRRGAWYRVLKVQGLKTILDVGGRPMSVASALLEIVKRPPPRWTVVTQTGKGAQKAPPAMAERYGVCPSCGERAALPRRMPRMRCTGCKWEFEIAWDEAYLT